MWRSAEEVQKRAADGVEIPAIWVEQAVRQPTATRAATSFLTGPENAGGSRRNSVFVCHLRSCFHAMAKATDVRGGAPACRA
jgi:hypothetical protein